MRTTIIATYTDSTAEKVVLSTTIEGDVPEEAARLAGLGLCFDHGLIPTDEGVRVEVRRSPLDASATIGEIGPGDTVEVVSRSDAECDPTIGSRFNVKFVDRKFVYIIDYDADSDGRAWAMYRSEVRKVQP